MRSKKPSCSGYENSFLGHDILVLVYNCPSDANVMKSEVFHPFNIKQVAAIKYGLLF